MGIPAAPQDKGKLQRYRQRVALDFFDRHHCSGCMGFGWLGNGDPNAGDGMCENCGGSGIESRDPRKDELLAWAYSKLQHYTFSKMDDALMMDEIKLTLMGAMNATPVPQPTPTPEAK